MLQPQVPDYWNQLFLGASCALDCDNLFSLELPGNWINSSKSNRNRLGRLVAVLSDLDEGQLVTILDGDTEPGQEHGHLDSRDHLLEVPRRLWRQCGVPSARDLQNPGSGPNRRCVGVSGLLSRQCVWEVIC